MTLKRSKLSIVAMLLCIVIGVQGQKRSETLQNTTEEDRLERIGDIYYPVLNILMPKVIPLTESVESVLTVRVQPSFEGEFQYIFIKRRNADKVEVIKKRSVQGNIDNLILNTELTLKKKVPAEEAANQIKLEEKRTSIPTATFAELVKNLDVTLNLQATWSAREELRRQKYVSRDGTRYVIWMAGERQYDVALRGTHYKSSPPEDESPLISWVRILVKEL